MFESVFNRLGHESVVEKNRGRREEMKKKKKKNRRKVAVFFVLFVFKIRNRVISWDGGR